MPPKKSSATATPPPDDDAFLDASDALPPPTGSTMVQPYTVPVTLPEFMQDEPDTWFLAVDAQFALRGIIQDECRFDLVYAKLPPSLMRAIARKVPHYTPGNFFESLRSDVLHYYSKGRMILADEILRDTKIDYDLKPSFALEAIWQKLQNNACDLVYACWVRKLPPAVASKIREEWLKDEKKLKQNADSLFEEFKYSEYQKKRSHQTHVNAVSHEHESSEPDTPSEDVVEPYPVNFVNSNRFPQKKRQFRAPAAKNRQVERQNGNSRNQNDRPPPRLAKDPTGTLCDWHFTFGNRAYRCQSTRDGQSCPLASTVKQQGNFNPGR